MYAVEMKNVTKRFGHTIANRQISFDVKKGEIHSLLGENGAGKTTLMKLLYGMYQPDEGNILINGRKIEMANPNVAIQNGIAMVHQHFMLIDSLSVAENVVLGFEPKKGLFYDKSRAIYEVEQISQKYGLKVNPNDKVKELPVGMKQRIEILKALYRKAEILILDEPTAVLTPLEVEDLFKVLKELRLAGKTVIIITHKLKETMAIADRATILRNGECISTVDISDSDTDQLAELMVGRKLFSKEQLPVKIKKEKRFELRNVTVTKQGKISVLKNVNFSLYSGEITGLAGVEGNGQTELIEVMTGLLQLEQGHVYFKEQEITNCSPIEFINLGIGHIPEDRNTLGLVGDFSIKENTILGYHRLPIFQRKMVFRKKEVTEFADNIRQHYNVKASSIDLPVRTLSGGNQQKIVIGRVLSQNPEVIIAAQPTRGVDIGAIEYIHEQLLEMRQQGKAILLISAELEEIRKLSDKIAVIYEGEIVANEVAHSFTDQELGALMTGGNRSDQMDEESEKR